MWKRYSCQQKLQKYVVYDGCPLTGGIFLHGSESGWRAAETNV